MMFVDFGKYKCPLCGDFGKELSINIFQCMKCAVMFNEYYISTNGEVEVSDKLWN